jgi:DNA-binding MarR family transcriptional regulator
MAEPDLSTLFHRLANITRRSMGAEMAQETWAMDAGFRPGCVGVLLTVERVGPVSQREVSERLLLDPSDLVSLVDILERAGFVERRRDPADRRRYALEVTRAGGVAAQRLRAVSRAAQERVLEPLDEHERRALSALLSRVVEHHSGLISFDLSDRATSARPSGGS